MQTIAELSRERQLEPELHRQAGNELEIFPQGHVAN